MPLVVVVLLLVGTNVVDNRLAPSLSLPVNLVVAGLLLVLARWDRLTPAELGLARSSAARGLRWAGVAAGAVAGAYLVVRQIEVTRRFKV